MVIPETDSDTAVSVRNAGHDFLSPDIFRLEVAHVLTKNARRGKLSDREASQGLIPILNDAPLLIDSAPLLSRAFNISIETRCSIYDALYVSLAEREQCEFVSADQKLINNLKDRFAFLLSLSSF